MAQAFLESQLQQNNAIFFFSKEGCPYCDKLTEALNELDLPYSKYMVSGNPEESRQLKEATGIPTYPMLFFGAAAIGGYSDFMRLQLTSQLQEKLKAIGIEYKDSF